MEFSLIEHPRYDYMTNLNFNEIYKFSGLEHKMIKLGIINKFNKDIKRRYVEFDVKYFDLNSISEFNIIQEKFNIFNNKLEKFSNNNIIHEYFAQDKEETKFDNSNKNSNKIESIFNNDLLDINKNIFENKCKNYISKNNLINKDFNFNKNNLKNIFKNQKIT